MRPFHLRPLALLSAALLALPLAASAQVVISQVYGGGGNSGAPLRSDFVELFNAGSESVSLEGWSVQYASSTGTSWQRTNLSGSIAPGQYYLVKQADGSNTAAPVLPTPDATGSIAMAASAGKVALVSSQTTLSGACPLGAPVVDFVGFGSASNCAEIAPTATLGNATAALRKGAGCTDTGNNAADFDVAAPAPRNSATAAAPCGGPVILVLSVADVALEEGDASSGSVLRFTFRLNAPALAGGVRFDVATADGTAVAGEDYVATQTRLEIAEGGREAFLDVPLIGDTVPEPDETLLVRVNNIEGASIERSEATGTIRNDDIVLVPIHAIQGSGSTSPLEGQVVVTEGIVTARRSNGFFLQTADGEDDGNPATSEGLFVFTGSTVFPAVEVSNRVRVSGRVVEFVPASAPNQRPITEITGGGGVSVQVSLRASGQPLPAAVELPAGDLAAGGPLEALERYEFMRVATGPLVTVAPSGAFLNERNATVTGSDGIFFAVRAGVPRPFREPGIPITDVIAASVPAGVPRFDTNPERLRIDSDGQLGAARAVADAGTPLPSLTGVLDYGNGVYTLLPDPGQLLGDATGLLPGGPAPKAVPDAPADALSLGSFNLLRFFDDVDDPGINEPVLTPLAFQARLRDTSEAICRFLKAPDVLGVVEVENLNALENLAEAINTNLSGACPINPQYQAYLLEGNDVGGIDVGVLVSTREVRPGTPRIRVVSVEQIGKEARFTNANGSTEPLNDRPSLAVRLEANAANGSQVPLTFVVNHLRSLIGVNDTAAGSQGWATVGERVRAKRAAQALYLAEWIEARQSAEPNGKLVLVGDFNAYEFSDGFVDVMGILTGRAAGPGEVLLHVPSPVTRLLTTLTTLAPPAERYSFTFDGNAQSLDHVVVNEAVLRGSLAVESAHAAINADFSETRFGQGPVRTSDHDPVVVRLVEGSFRSADLGVAVEAPASVAAGAAFTFGVRVTNRGPDAASLPRLRLVLDRPVTEASVSAPGWSCEPFRAVAGRGEAECRRESLASGSGADVEVRVPAGRLGEGQSLSLEASLEALSVDPASADNLASASVSVPAQAPADLMVAVLVATSGNGKVSPTATFAVAPANAGPGRAADVRLEITFRGPSGMLGPVLSLGWDCTRQPLATGVRLSCRFPVAEVPATLLPPLLLTALPRDFDGDETVSVEAVLQGSRPDLRPENNRAAASARIRVGRGR
ncbi:MAG: nuclease [Silanimonas sp.]|nr:MAG: nuclease [Silanimonas sp.]